MYPPPSEAEFREVEEVTSFAVPEALKRIYLDLGNGGFGPEYGVLGLRTGHQTDMGDTALSLYEQFCTPDEEDPDWS